LLDDPELRTNFDRVARREKFIPEIRTLFLGLTLVEALDRCERAGLPFAPVVKPEDLFDDPQVNRTGAMLDITLDDGRSAQVPALPLELSGSRLGLRRDIPSPGEHQAEILAELALPTGAGAGATEGVREMTTQLTDSNAR
jgi:crotonobetainyl-CoA:carnitine CoA-transferase CaiB-like acyl-CoA transferase